MRALARLLVQIAAGNYIVDRQSDTAVKASTDGQDVGVGERRVELGVVYVRRLLEVRVVVVPRAQLVDGQPVIDGQLEIHLALGSRERAARQCVKLVKQLQHLLGFLLGHVEAKVIKVL